MKLSVIIVSYKVPYFLEQTLLSVRKAASNVPIEIIVVDNNSQDDTVAMLHQKFPEVLLIANKKKHWFCHRKQPRNRPCYRRIPLVSKP